MGGRYRGEGQIMKLESKARCLLLTMALVAGGAAHGAGAVKPSEPSLLGTWSLDTSRMPLPPEQRPKSVRFAFSEAGAGKLSVHVDIVYAPGSEIHSASLAPLDGGAVAVENSPEADHVTLRRPTPGVLVMALQKNGVLVSTRIYSVAPDNRTLIETNVHPGEKGDLVMRTNYFQRSQ